MKADNKSMISFFRVQFICVLGLTFALSSFLHGAEDAAQEKGVTHNGIVFNIAKDRKIEKIGGLYEPEGIDKYVERKIDEVNVRIAVLEEKLNESNKKLDDILKNLAQNSAASKENEIKA